jgi:hypothetical protein
LPHVHLSYKALAENLRRAPPASATLAHVGISPAQLVTILSASIAPVIMISGVGLLLLSMTNRYSRVIDRARNLVERLDSRRDSEQLELMLEELRITYRRGRILRMAIILSSFSILFVAITVFSLFAEQVLGVRVDYFSVPCFGLALVALLASLYLFIRDLGISLAGLELEIGPYLKLRKSK